MGDDMTEVNKQFQEINSTLEKISDEQFETLNALAKYEEGEKDFFVMNQQSHHLFQRLFHTWKKDRELFHKLEETQSRLQYEKRKIMDDLETKRERSTETIKRLNDQEDHLYHRLRSLKREESR